MDAPPPDDFDPYSLLNDQAYAGDDEGDDGEQYSNHDGDGDSLERRPKKPRRKPARERSKFPHNENSMYQRAIDWALSLLAPPRNASPLELRRHAVSLSIAVALIYAHIAIACGWLSSIGLSGFASASTVSSVQAEVMDVRVTLYAVAIRDLHRSYCNAVNYEDSLTLSNQLQEMQVKYQKTVGLPYVLPACPKRG